jgi:CelD/BcsL family acetyltransferase involved in cellulose biosynthesis
MVRLDGDWDSYLGSRSKKVRHEIRRKQRRLERAGTVQWQTVSDPDEAQMLMEDILHIERRSWKEGNRTSFTAVPHLADFYAALSVRCAHRGWLRTYILYIDKVPVAHMFGVVHRDEYYALKTSFDERCRDLSPGSVLAAHALKEAFTAGLRVFDFQGVPSRWKKELANAEQEYVHVCMFTPYSPRCRACVFYHDRIRLALKHHLPSFRSCWRLIGARN